jgi:hypothetical protein
MNFPVELLVIFSFVSFGGLLSNKIYCIPEYQKWYCIPGPLSITLYGSNPKLIVYQPINTLPTHES